MSGKAFLDTNILVYAFSNDAAKAPVAEAILSAGGVISVQVFNEFANVCLKKLKLDWKEIEERLGIVRVLAGEVVPLTVDLHEKAVILARDHKLAFYDALILASAHCLGCSRLLTEDLHHGLVLNNLRVENPFLQMGG
jgi:predicted nucleic acid-binding protein